VLEYDYKSTFAKSLRTLFVRNFAVVKQLDTIGFREMFAPVREHIALPSAPRYCGESPPALRFEADLCQPSNAANASR